MKFTASSTARRSTACACSVSVIRFVPRPMRLTVIGSPVVAPKVTCPAWDAFKFIGEKEKRARKPEIGLPKCFAGTLRRQRTFSRRTKIGPVAHLVERVVRNDEVRGSSPLRSTLHRGDPPHLYVR